LEVSSPDREQRRIELADGAVGLGQPAHVQQGGREDPDDAQQHDQALEEVRVGDGQVAAQERVDQDDRDGENQRHRIRDARDQGQTLSAGDELGDHVEGQQEDREARRDETGSRRGVAVLEVLDRGERAESLGELAHPPADQRHHDDAPADVPGGVPERPVAVREAERAGAQEHEAAHGGALEREGRHHGAEPSAAQKESLQIVPRTPAHGEEADPEDDQVVEPEKGDDRGVHAESSSSRSSWRHFLDTRRKRSV
jgi:hypothetical protein